MEVCIAHMHGKDIILELRENIAYLDGEPLPVKYLTAEKLEAFNAAIQALPREDEDGYRALVNAKRAAFLVDMLATAVGDECINKLTHILDHVHYDVLEYLGETGDATSPED